MTCKQCGRKLDGENTNARVVSMSGSIMGDECTDTYYLCPDCDVYTVEQYWDYFSGGESASEQGPVARADGDDAVASIRQCAEPWNKKCRCPSHRAHFGGSLD
jgi:hypothetical protein